MQYKHMNKIFYVFYKLYTNFQLLILYAIYSKIKFATQTIYSVNFQKLETGVNYSSGFVDFD